MTATARASPPPSPGWRTEMYTRLGQRLERVLGDKAAKAFEPL